MIATLACAAMGAFAENTCAPEEITPTLVYKFKATVYTPKGVTPNVKAAPASVCAPSGEGGESTSTTIRAKDKTKFAGWIYDCTATCDTVANGSIVVWDSKRKVQLSDAAMAKEFIHVIGKKGTQAEWYWGLTGTANYDASRAAAYDVKLAGFGKYSIKKGYYTSFSGKFAGSVDKVYDLKAKTEAACVPAGYFDCTDLTALVSDDAAVAYGCWSVKYSSSASKKFLRNGYLKVPAYVTLGEEGGEPI